MNIKDKLGLSGCLWLSVSQSQNNVNLAELKGVAWEPSAAKVTKKLLLHLNDFTGKLNFRY